jgi:GntR family transcriptional regulator / MocR family aminotransferase
MDLHVRLEGRRGLSQQIHRQVRAAILDGRLRRGDQLPPSCELAPRLGVARNTVAIAYAWLGAEGLVSGRAGAGSFVAGGPAAVRPRRATAPAAIVPRRLWARLDDPTPVLEDSPFNFRVGVSDPALFPYDTWRRLMSRQLRPRVLSAAYGDAAGHPALRAAAARHAYASRGLGAEADDVLVTQGAQHALDVIGRVLLEPGARVAVEDPGYPAARVLFESLGAAVVGVPVDAEGLDVGALPADAKLVYVTPSHQFPLGVTMSHARRLALLEWANRRNAVVIEDDYDSEFRFGGRPLETLHALDRSGRVVYVGTFSKVLLPALRLGFAVAPFSLRRALAAAVRVSSAYAHWPAQGALAAFLDGGLLARHVRRARRSYAARHLLVAGALTGDLSRWLELIPSSTGLHLCGKLRAPWGVGSEGEVWSRARAQGVRFDRLSRFACARPGRAGVVLGYGAIAEGRIDEGLSRLQGCLAAVLRGRGS